MSVGHASLLQKNVPRLSAGLQLPKIRQSGACRFQSPPDQPCSTVQSITHSAGALITCHMFKSYAVGELME
jgi:hypothetical protein